LDIARFWKVFTGPAETACPSRLERSSLSRLSASLVWLTPATGDRQSRPTVLIHSSNRIRYGNCNSPKVETASGYLTRLGAVSNRSWPHSSCFRVTDGARTPPDELVNPASSPMPFGLASEGPRQTSLTPPLPSHLGLSWSRPAAIDVAAASPMDNPRRLGKGRARLVGSAPLKPDREVRERRQDSPVPLAAFARCR
jgi:hypothetical protein